MKFIQDLDNWKGEKKCIFRRENIEDRQRKDLKSYTGTNGEKVGQGRLSTQTRFIEEH